MSITAGVISLVKQGPSDVHLSATDATGGTGPYTYQWYMSTVSGFVPGGGNILSGQTSLTLDKTGLVPGGTYFFKLVATDTGHSNDTAEYPQFQSNVPVAGTPDQNQFAQTPVLGMQDLMFNYNTVSAMIDVSQIASQVLRAGSGVKLVNSAGGIPKVVGCALDSDQLFGIINFDIKSQFFGPGSVCEISQAGNVIYLMASAAIARGVQVVLDQAALTANAPGVVKAAAGVTGANIIGWAFDAATAANQLIRVKLMAPSFLTAS